MNTQLELDLGTDHIQTYHKGTSPYRPKNRYLLTSWCRATSTRYATVVEAQNSGEAFDLADSKVSGNLFTTVVRENPANEKLRALKVDCEFNYTKLLVI